MRKTFVGAAVIAAMAGIAPAAEAQQQGGVTFGVSGGLTLPVGDIGNTNGSGFNLQGHAGFRPAAIPFGLRADLGLWTNPGKSITPIGGGTTQEYEGITWFTGNVNGVFNFETAKDATFVPYAIGGIGIYNGSRDGNLPEIGTKFGINGGGGVTFKLSGFDAFAEARFHNIFTDGNSARLIPISFGINFKP